jgi:hypothetical protein
MRLHLFHSLCALLVAVMLWGTVAEDLLAQSKVGTTAAPFLGIGVGTRAVSMGSAFVAMKDDPTMLYWNPGAISKNQSVQASFIHANWLVGTAIDWAGITTNFGDIGTFGFSLMRLGSGDIERTTEEFDNGTGEFFSIYDAVFQVGYARSLTNQFSVGLSFKYILQSLYRTSASTVAIDLGVHYDINNRLRLAAVLSNFGGSLQPTGIGLLTPASTGTGANGENNSIASFIATDTWNLPVFFRVGIAADVVSTTQNRITLVMDGVSPSDNDNHLNIGAEIAWRELIMLRGGYNTIFMNFAETGYTCGIGIRAEIIRYIVKIDYAYQSFGRFSAPQWVTIGVVF